MDGGEWTAQEKWLYGVECLLLLFGSFEESRFFPGSGVSSGGASGGPDGSDNSGGNSEEERPMCPMCRESSTEADDVMIPCDCGQSRGKHMVGHANCLRNWWLCTEATTCPVCRGDVSDLRTQILGQSLSAGEAEARQGDEAEARQRWEAIDRSMRDIREESDFF